MKLIIDIPKTMIQDLKDGCFGVKHNVYELAGCIMKGTPLDDVKAEIADLPTDMLEVYKLKSRVLYMLDNIGKDKGGE